MLTIIALLLGLPGGVTPQRPPAPVKVVTSLTTYAAIAREIVGDRGQVNSIAVGDENPHYVQPKPSFVPLLAEADVFVTTGLDLELWVPALLDKAGNSKVTEGAPGYVAAYSGIQLLDPPRATRARRETFTSSETRISGRSRSTASKSHATSSRD